jgi:DNA-binding NarL/FixJ family response regulator
VGTVKIHVSKIMKTLGVSNRAAAALMVKRKQRRQGATT